MTSKLFNIKKILLGVFFIILSLYMQIITHYGDATVLNLKYFVFLNLLQFVLIVLFCFSGGGLKQRFAFFVFNLSYELLLLGTYICNINNDSLFGKHIFSAISVISYKNEAIGLCLIQFAQAIIFIGYSCFVRTYRNNFHNFGMSKLRNMRYICVIVMFIGGIAAFIKIGAQILFVARFGYFATYLASGNELFQNPIVDLFDRFYLLGFYGYLATFPRIKQLILPFSLFILYSIMTLLTGVRAEFLINIFFIIWYFSKIETRIHRNVFISKKSFIFLSIFIVFVLIPMLQDYNYSRIGQKTVPYNKYEKIVQFIDMHGRTGKLIGLGMQYRDNMITYISPSMMVLYPIRNFIINNSVSRIFTGGHLGQSVDNIYTVGHFGSVLTYITNPNAYFSGGGLGTSFVAELSVSYGMVAVLVFCFILGKILYYLDNINAYHWNTNVLLMNTFGIVIYLPRGATLGIIPASVAPLIFICLMNIILFCLKILSNSNHNKFKNKLVYRRKEQ